MTRILLFVSREYFMSGELAFFALGWRQVLKVFANEILVFTNQQRGDDKWLDGRNNFPCRENFSSRRNAKGFSHRTLPTNRPLVRKNLCTVEADELSGKTLANRCFPPLNQFGQLKYFAYFAYVKAFHMENSRSIFSLPT